METPDPCPSPRAPLADAAGPEPVVALPWIGEPMGESEGRTPLRPATGSLLDRCVIALTMVTAASLLANGYAQTPPSRELLPVMVVTSAN